jgi:hypothetical protein
MNEPQAGYTVADAGLHDWMTAELAIADWQPATTEAALHAVLDPMDGVRILAVFDEKVSIEYDPVQIPIADLCAVLAQHGFRATRVLSGPSSPVSDALHPQD